MNIRFFLLLSLILFLGCESTKNLNEVSSNEKFAIVLHGGAGTILKETMSDSLEAAYREKLTEAITAGYQILKNGGTSLDAVSKTINILEDSPLFNAGKGAVFTHEGRNELDASIMDGKTLNAGAVSGVRRIQNPINLAREVMENSPHVLLSGMGAEEFARERGFTFVDTSYFYTERSWNSLQNAKRQANKKAVNQNEPKNHDSKFGTVGAAALDKHGNLAAGTSTGGMTNKRWNRIGDSPIIGAGTYANNNTCAVSSTGWGEKFIRSVVAYDISALMEYKGWSLQQAAKEVIHKKLPKIQGDGGIVAIDKDGNIAMEFNTPGMYRASVDVNGKITVELYK